MSLPVIAYDELHPPRLVTCHGCGQERLSRRDHPALEGESSLCGDCRRLVATLEAGAAALKVTHPTLAARFATEARLITERT